MTEIHNPRSNDSIDQYYLRLDCTNDPLTAGLDIAPDTDVISTFGRWKAGYESIWGADGAVLAHFDMFNNTDFALAQDNAGDTYLNSGRFTYLLSDGNYYARLYTSGADNIFHIIDTTVLAIGGGLGSEQVEITQSGTDPTILDIDTDYSNLLLNVNGSINADATITGLTIVGANVTSGADPGHTHTGGSVSGFLVDDANDVTTGGIEMDYLHITGTSSALTLTESADDFTLANPNQDKDIIFDFNDGGVSKNFTIDASANTLDLGDGMLQSSITANERAIYATRTYAVGNGDTVNLVDFTNTISAGSINIATQNNLNVETTYLGTIVQWNYANIRGTLDLTGGTGWGTGASASYNILGHTLADAGENCAGVTALLSIGGETAVLQGADAAIQAATKANEASAIYGAYTRADNEGTGIAYGYQGYGYSTEAGTSDNVRAVGVWGFAGTAVNRNCYAGVYAYALNINPKGYGLWSRGNNWLEYGISYFRATTGLTTAYATTHIATNDYGSVYIEKYLEVDDTAFFDATGTSIEVLGDTKILADSKKAYVGGGSDFSRFYDGADAWLKTDEVAASDLLIACGANKTIELQNVVWDDIQFVVESGRVSAANFPDWDATFTTNTGCYKFDVNDFIDLGSNEMLHWWKEGTLVYPHIHIALDGANGSGGSYWVKFTLYIAYADTSEVYTETSKDIEIEIPDGTADLTHLLGESSSLDFTTIKIGSQVNVRLKRIAATSGDEYPNHIFVTQVGIHAEKDTMGSRQIITK